MSLCLLRCIRGSCDEEILSYNRYYKKGCGFTQVPTDIRPEKTDVKLDGNNITNISAGVFSHLKYCNRLSLQDNKITYIGRGMFEGLKSLELLYLNGNDISDIEEGSFSHLKRCTSLNLYQNKLSYIKAAVFEGLQSLEILELNNNEIKCHQHGSSESSTSTEKTLVKQ